MYKNVAYENQSSPWDTIPPYDNNSILSSFQYLECDVACVTNYSEGMEIAVTKAEWKCESPAALNIHYLISNTEF